ncbi:MAG: amidohydrolase family protein, partial [Erythrobacter sp.]|nr:amidohydrolase family protein [Erythrobacter sp.]
MMASLASCQSTPPVEPAHDLLIRGGLLVDGTGSAPRLASIVVDDGIIFAVLEPDSKLPAAVRVIKAEGLIVAPGFIDPHTHADEDLGSFDRARRANLPFAFQGVTTVVVGNDGAGAPDIARQAQFARVHGIGTNVAYLVGFSPVRRALLNMEDRAPQPAELATMRKSVRQAMCEGAWGFSAGLYYVPQSYSQTDEVIALASEAGKLGGYYDTHLRDESTYSVTVTGALEEALRIGREGGLPVHVSHIKALGPAVWGQSEAMIRQVEAARASGQRVTADQYPWDASGTRISAALVPRWALEGGLPALRQRLSDPDTAKRVREGIVAGLARRGGAQRLLITGALAGLDIETGQTLADYSAKLGVDHISGAVAILEKGDARVASFNMDEADIAAFARQPWVVTGSDGSSGHPRKYASFPKAYADLVKGDAGMTLARFVQRSTSQTAAIIGLTDRGAITSGLTADIVVFDPDEFGARATYQSPRALSAGVRYLLVNGKLAINGGEYTGGL